MAACPMEHTFEVTGSMEQPEDYVVVQWLGKKTWKTSVRVRADDGSFETSLGDLQRELGAKENKNEHELNRAVFVSFIGGPKEPPFLEPRWAWLGHKLQTESYFPDAMATDLDASARLTELLAGATEFRCHGGVWADDNVLDTGRDGQFGARYEALSAGHAISVAVEVCLPDVDR
eukprot:TRINITY_DN63988_c0_g1_i1.p1 TRINITY_DN63988_c0_g1~~TRINITY_DN63988_c0_g1_i1.p1  ORF type:complete len:192 (+),score=30.96 TRINITY_DN63988_c0_g1_i1:53-577(+)